MKRTDLMDTKPEIHREIVRRLRAMTPAERLSIAFQRCEIGWQIHRLAIERLRKKSA